MAEITIRTRLPAVRHYRPLLLAWSGAGRHVVGVELRGMPQSPVADLRRDSWGQGERELFAFVA